MIYLLIGFAFIGSFILTRLLISITHRLGIVDAPNERSSHETITPRGGGLSFVIIFFICLSILYITNNISNDLYLSLFVGGFAIAAIGLLDDYSHINAGIRLFVHIMAAIAVLICIGGLQFIQVFEHIFKLELVGYLVALIIIVWLLNLFNFMDGIDGLAGIEAIFVATAAALISMSSLDKNPYVNQLVGLDGQTTFVLLLILSFSVLGFLIYNWPPARIFMGDVGSGFLGYVFGVLIIATTMIGIITIWVWMILLGVFIIDATITLIRRIFEGKRWYAAHRTHAYQHATQRWGSHLKITMAVLAINIIWLLPIAWLANIKPVWGSLLTLIAYIPLFFVAVYFKAGKT